MWQAVGASVIGTGHIRSGKPCQDYHGHHVLNECVIAAVADGIGSAGRSEEGAKIAVNASIDHLKESIGSIKDRSKNIVRHAFLKAREALENVSETQNTELRDYATTLLVAIAFPDMLITGHIGDGGIVGMKEDGLIITLSPPLKMEHANDVVPVTADYIHDNIRISAYDHPFSAFALFTDGIQGMALILAENAPYGPFFSPFFKAVTNPMDTKEASEKLKDFLLSEKVCKMTDDDKTLLVLGRVKGPVHK